MYNKKTFYKPGDTCVHGGKEYTCMSACQGVEPGTHKCWQEGKVVKQEIVTPAPVPEIKLTVKKEVKKSTKEQLEQFKKLQEALVHVAPPKAEESPADFLENYKERVVLKGAQGPRGAAGRDGDTGPKGDKGDTGPVGPKGDAGAAGKDGTDGVGLVYTWEGTKLGIRREDEPGFTFMDLQGPEGKSGKDAQDRFVIGGGSKFVLDSVATGTSLIKAAKPRAATLKSLVAGSNISFTDDGSSITISSTGAVWGSITGTITDQTDLINYLDTGYVPYSGATGSVDLNGYDITNVSIFDGGDFTAFNSMLAPNFYIGYGSPTAHMYDDALTGVGLAYYGNPFFVGYSYGLGQPFFGADPSVNSTGMSFDGTSFSVAAQGGQPVCMTFNSGIQIQGDSFNNTWPLFNVYDTGTGYDDTLSIGEIIAGYGDENRVAFRAYADGSATLGGDNIRAYNGGSGYLAGGYVTWNTTGQFAITDTPLTYPTFAKLESISTTYSQLLLGWDATKYVLNTVASTSGMAWRPSANTTSGYNFQNAAGSSIVNIDTSNQRVGIGGITTPLYQFHTSGDAMFGSSNATPIIRLGGNTSSHVALKRSSTTMQCILANDAGSFATFSAGRIVANGEAVQSATGMVVIGNGGVFLGGANSYYGFTASNNAAIGATPDVNLSRNSAGILQIGTSAMGATGSLYLASVGSSSAKTIYNASTAATVIDYDINASATANNILIRLGNGTVSTATSGVTNLISSTPSINQSGTAGYTISNINVTETATGSGAKNIAKWAVGGTTVFNVDNAGATTIGAGSAAISKVYTATATLDFPSIAHNSYADLTMTVTGATTGSVVIPGAPAALEAGIGFSMWVSAADTVTVRIHNMSGGAVDPASATWRATVIKH
jgi:hypothetical protein